MLFIYLGEFTRRCLAAQVAMGQFEREDMLKFFRVLKQLSAMA
jgi:hypothetical protein